MTSRQLRETANKAEVRGGQREVSTILLASLIKQVAHEWVHDHLPDWPRETRVDCVVSHLAQLVIAQRMNQCQYKLSQSLPGFGQIR